MKQLQDKRDHFLYCISLPKLRLKNLPNFIFFCGGCTARTERKSVENIEEKYQSMRKAIGDVLFKFAEFNEKIIYAETYQDWLHHGNVSNLIDFEMAIADMAGAIVLILEAPGAYAELGSFSVIDNLASKLILVVNENTLIETSYINLGPVKYLEDNSRIVLKYKWDAQYIVNQNNKHEIRTLLNGDTSDIHEKAMSITEDLNRKYKEITVKSPTIDLERNGHICFIIGDLIYNFGGLKLHEIVGYLKDYFEIKNATMGMVKSCLYILCEFDFVEKVSQGEAYYIPTDKNKGFIKYSFSENIVKETGCKSVSEIRNNQLVYYSSNEQSRFKAIQENDSWM